MNMSTGKIKRSIFSLLIVISFLTFAVESAFAGFGEIGMAARPLSMGRAYVAVANDPTAIFFNPAGLTQMRSIALTTTYGRLFPGIDDDGIHLADAAVTVPFTELFTFGAAVTSLNVSAYNENIFFGTVAARLPFNVSVGANVKLYRWSTTGYYDPDTAIRDKDFSKTTFSFDAGVLYVSPELSETILGKFIKSGRLQVGLQISDLLRPSIAENDSKAGKLPLVIDGGVAYINESFTFAASIFNRDEMTKLRLGCEVEALSVFSAEWATKLLLRGGGSRGLSDFQGGEFDAGFGLLVRGIAIDYAYLHPMELRDVGGSHRISLGYTF
jgi:hypothetical protein